MAWFDFSIYDKIFVTIIFIFWFIIFTRNSAVLRTVFRYFYAIAYFTDSKATLLYESGDFRSTYSLYLDIKQRLSKNGQLGEISHLVLAPLNGTDYYNPLRFNRNKLELIRFYYNLFFIPSLTTEYSEHKWGAVYFRSWCNSNVLKFYIYISWDRREGSRTVWFYL